MKLSCIALAAVAAAGSVSASAVARGGDAYHHDKPPCGGSCPPPQPPIPPPRPSPDSDTCPIAQCVVDTTNTYWDFANLRPNPCNNKPALKVMYTGDAVYDLLVPYKSGCGYTYAQVLLPALDNGQEQMIGWMDVNALNCHSHNKPIPPPAPAPAAEEVLVDDNSSPQS